MLSVFFLLFPRTVLAQTQPDQFFRAKVEAITNQGETITDNQTLPFQEVKLQILDAPEKGKEITVEYGQGQSLTPSQLVNVGDTVVIDKTTGPDGNPIYQITDKYRLR